MQSGAPRRLRPLSGSSCPLPAVLRPKIAIAAGLAGSEYEPAGMQVVEVGADHSEQTAQVCVSPRRPAMKRNLRRLGLHQTADLQGRFPGPRCLPKQMGIAAKLDLVNQFGKLLRTGRRFEIDDHRSG